MVKVLSEAPERWGKIFTVSQHPSSNPEHRSVDTLAVDFLSSGPKEIAKIFKDNQVKARVSPVPILTF